MARTEILAPAGNIETLYSALKMGADAVYTGTSRFGARAFADNPTVEELEKALTYAHLRGKKIYLTVNTLLSTHEIEEELYPLIRPLYEAGLDACIVQDVGVMSYLHTCFPDMELHASTQMTLFSGEEASLYKRYGITRYVPARELTIQEIRQARKETDLEIEVFVHGALCYCYSGQCLMSEEIGGRSGNRGMCAQPCRLAYRTPYGDGCVLNTKDICTLAYIPALVDAGIDSFKIEGRMKKKEYSAYTAYLYRKYTDLYIEKGKEWYHDQVENKGSNLWKDYEALQDLFNRGGFSDSFLFENQKKKMVYVNKNGHFGSFAGTVKKTGNKEVSFVAATELHYQDVLEFRDDNDIQTYEYTVKNPAKKGKLVTTNIKKGSRIKVHDRVYRRRNNYLLEKIQNAILETEDKVALKGYFEATIGEPVRFSISGNGAEAEVCGEVCQIASKRPVGVSDVKKAIAAVGNTGYAFVDLEIDIPENAFFSVGGIKKLRRQAIEEWEKNAVLHRKCPGNYKKNPICTDVKEKAPDGIYVAVSSVEQIQCIKKYKKKDVIFIFKMLDFSYDKWEKACNLLKNEKVVLEFPRILHGRKKEVFEKRLQEKRNIWGEMDISMIMINSHQSFILAKKYFPDCKYLSDENMYRMNRLADRFYEDFSLVAAPERNYGRRAVMVTEGCVAASMGYCSKEGEKPDGRIRLEGPKGDVFVVVSHCEYCFNTVYTEKPVILPQKGKKMRVDFTWEKEDEIRKVMNEWNI